MSRTHILSTLAAVALAACGGEDLVLPSEGEPARIRVVQGDGQTGRAGEELFQPLVVEVTDAAERPVAGASVVTEVAGGDADPDTAVTGDDGRASVAISLGPDTGPVEGVARVLTPEDRPPVAAEFTLTAVAASANGLRLVSGDGQAAAVGEVLPEPLVVEVADAFGNPVEGVAIAWAPVGGGSVGSSTTTTDAQGRASVTRTLGDAAGEQRTLASADGLAGSPVVFVHTARPGTAAGVRIVSGNDQSGPAGQALPADLVVGVADADGNPVSGATVQWRVLTGGGTVEPSSSTTGADGQARARWTLGGTAGTNTLEASVADVGSVTFEATATAGEASALAIRTQPSASARVGVPFDRQPVIQLRDASGNAVARSGVPVTAAVASGGGSLGGTTTRSTDGSGLATFTDLEIGGATGTHTVIFAADGFTSATSSPIQVGAAPTTTRITADDPDPSVAGTEVSVAFEVTSPGGTPTGTVTVTVEGGAETCSADVSAGGCTLALTAVGTRTLTASYGGSPLFEASSGTAEHTVEGANSAPVAAGDAYTVLEDQALDVPAPGVLGNDQDSDGDPLTAALAGAPSAGTVELAADGGFRYTPPPDFSGEVTFTYTVQDGAGGQATGNVTITVQPVNDPPGFVPSTTTIGVSALEGAQVVPGWATGMTAGPGEEGQALEFLVSVPEDQQLFDALPAVSPDGTLTYDPGAPGTVTVEVRLRDSGGTENGGVDTSDPVLVTFDFGGCE